MLVKFIDKYKIKIADIYEILIYDNIQVINPKEQDFINAGYKELVEEHKPLYNEETEVINPYYEEKNNFILKEWEVFEIPEEEE